MIKDSEAAARGGYQLVWMAFLMLTEKFIWSPQAVRPKHGTDLHITPQDEKEQWRPHSLRNSSSLLFLHFCFLSLCFCVLLLQTFLSGALLAPQKEWQRKLKTSLCAGTTLAGLSCWINWWMPSFSKPCHYLKQKMRLLPFKQCSGESLYSNRWNQWTQCVVNCLLQDTRALSITSSWGHQCSPAQISSSWTELSSSTSSPDCRLLARRQDRPTSSSLLWRQVPNWGAVHLSKYNSFS